MSSAAIPGAPLLRLIAVALLGIPVFVWDLRYRRIPDMLTIAAFATGGVLWLMTSPGTWWELATAVCLGLCIPLAARVASGGGLGWGDIKLSMSLSLFTGWPGIIVALGAGAALALAGVVVGRSLRNEAGVPFGPFLIGGAIIAIAGEILRGESVV